MFRKTPAFGTFTTRAGAEVETGFRVYDGKGVGLVATANADAVRRMLAGTGYQPVLTPSGRAVVSLWIMAYRDTSAGAYHELFVSIPVSREGRTLAGDSAWDTTLGAADPTRPGEVFVPRLLLDAQTPIDYGREYMGLPKEPRPGSFTMEWTAEGLRFAAVDAANRPVVQGTLPIAATPAQRLEAPWALMKRLGVWNGLKAIAASVTGATLRADTLSRNPLNGELVRNPGQVSNDYEVIPSADNVHMTYDPASPFGKVLSDLDLTPSSVLSWRNPRMLFGAPLSEKP
ncbi:MAG: acetoacetate decarboxylase family protein [Myxococcota bacterium]